MARSPSSDPDGRKGGAGCDLPRDRGRAEPAVEHTGDLSRVFRPRPASPAVLKRGVVA